ncbi:MAG: DNA-3-methyladenine glycosylase 2 family protein [Pseudomonadota bacterium]
MTRSIKTLSNPGQISAAIAELKPRCDGIRLMHRIAGDPPLRRYAPGFEGLACIITGQQLSTASASAIFKRLSATCAPLTPYTFLATAQPALRAAGLSRNKIETISNLASRIESGDIRLVPTARANREVFRQSLLDQKGIGPWTVDIYEMFCLGEPDAFAPGDMALQEAAKRAFALPNRPNTAQTIEIAEKWRPYRAVAAALLWSYYATGHFKSANNA